MSAARDLMGTGTAGPWAVDPDRWAPPGWDDETAYLRVVAGEPNEISGIRRPVVSTSGGQWGSDHDRDNYADARKIVLSVNALPLVANYDDAVMAYLRHQTTCQHGPGCVTLPTLWTALTAARDALEAALRGEGE